MNLVPELDVVEQRGLVEIHEAAVVVHLLLLVILGGVDGEAGVVVGGLYWRPGPVQRLDDRTVLTNVDSPTEDKPGQWVSHPDLLSLHC